MNGQNNPNITIGHVEANYISKITKIGLLSSLAAALLTIQQTNTVSAQFSNEPTANATIDSNTKFDLSPVIKSFRQSHEPNNILASSSIQSVANFAHGSHASHSSHSSHSSHVSSSGSYTPPYNSASTATANTPEESDGVSNQTSKQSNSENNGIGVGIAIGLGLAGIGGYVWNKIRKRKN